MCSKVKSERNEEGAAPCKCCLHRKHKLVYPKVVEIDELYYAQCPECTYYNQYEFLGCSKKRSIENWNSTMESKAAYFK